MAKMTPLLKQLTCFAGKDPTSKHMVESPMHEIVVHTAFRYLSLFLFIETTGTARIIRYTRGYGF